MGQQISTWSGFSDVLTAPKDLTADHRKGTEMCWDPGEAWEVKYQVCGGAPAGMWPVVHAGGTQERLSPSLESSIPGGFCSNLYSSSKVQRQTLTPGAPVAMFYLHQRVGWDTGIRSQPGHLLPRTP